MSRRRRRQTQLLLLSLAVIAAFPVHPVDAAAPRASVPATTAQLHGAPQDVDPHTQTTRTKDPA